MNPHRPFFQTTFFVILGRMGGLLFPFVVAFLYGATTHTDAFFLAYGLILYLTGILAHIFELVIVPYLMERKGNLSTMRQFLNAVLSKAMPWVAGVTVLTLLFLAVVLIHVSGWDKQGAHLATRLYAELIPFLFLAWMSSVGNGLFFTHKVFWFPALSPFFRWSLLFALIFCTHAFFGIHALTVGIVLGEALRVGLAIMLLRKTIGGQHAKEEEGKKRIPRFESNFYPQIAIQIFGLAATSAIYFVDLYFASWLGQGSVSLFNYADRLLQVPYLIFQEGFLRIFYSFWSEDYYQSSPTTFWQQSRRDLGKALGVAVVVALLGWFGRGAMVHLVFSPSGLSQNQLNTLSTLFGWLALSFPSAIVGALYTRMLFVMKHSAVYCGLGWAHLGLKILFNALLIQRFGIIGIAFATLMVNTLEMVFLIFYFKKKQLV